MLRIAAFACILLLAPPAWSAPVGTFSSPPPTLLEQLQRHHHRHDWLRVGTDSARLEVRVRQIGVEGLSGLSARRSVPLATDLIPWSSIARIDRRVSRFRYGQITGVVAGLGVGALAGHLIGSNWTHTRTVEGPYGPYESIENHSSSGPRVGMLLGALGGGWLGGRLGDQIVSERPFYVAKPEPPLPVIDAAAESLGAASDPPAMDAAALARMDVSPEIQQACRRIDSTHLLRIRGELGLFQGFASQVGPKGLDGLRADFKKDPYASAPLSLTWDQIDRIEQRSGSAGRGALSGGAAVGTVGGLFGFALVMAFGGTTTQAVVAAAESAAITGLVGAGIGAAFGAGVPRWRVVYERP